MESAISQLYNLPSDKKEGEAFAEMLKKEIPAERNPLNVLVILKVLEKVLKDVLTDDDIDAAFLKDFEQHAKDNKLLVNGVNITSQEYGAKYDYSGDEKWREYESRIKYLTDLKKKLEETLKLNAEKVPGKVKVKISI